MLYDRIMFYRRDIDPRDLNRIARYRDHTPNTIDIGYIYYIVIPGTFSRCLELSSTISIP